MASIKENVSGGDNASVRAQPGGRVSVGNNSLRNIIRNAYNVQNYQIVGGPDWINTVRWDITAKAPDDAPPQELLLMLRTLLADRFKLAVRNETREMPIYALTTCPSRRPARSAVTLVEYGLRCHLRGRQGEGRDATADHQRPAHVRHAYHAGQHDDDRRCHVRFARNLAPFAGRPVVDKTGLSGAFDLDLTWTPEQGPSAAQGTQPPAAPSSDGVSLFTSVQEQLGLKLDAQRGPVDVVVIESAERPVED